MTECIDDIRTKIETVERKSDNSIIDEVKINKYLDAILAVQKIIDEVSSDLDSLVEELYAFFKCETQDTYLNLKPSLESLYKTVSSFYLHARKSKFYSGAKSSIKECHSSVVALRELIDDLNLFLVELPNDEEHIHLVQRINDLLA